MEDLQELIRNLMRAASTLSLKLERVNRQVEKLMEEKRNTPFQGSPLSPVPLSSMEKKNEFVIPETEFWEDDDEPPFSLQFDLDKQHLKLLRRRAASKNWRFTKKKKALFRATIYQENTSFSNCHKSTQKSPSRPKNKVQLNLVDLIFICTF